VDVVSTPTENTVLIDYFQERSSLTGFRSCKIAALQGPLSERGVEQGQSDCSAAMGFSGWGEGGFFLDLAGQLNDNDHIRKPAVTIWQKKSGYTFPARAPENYFPGPVFRLFSTRKGI
jgi:hypothetical protein